LKRDPEGTSVARRWAERELLFWTIRQTCFITLLAAGTICAVISLVAGGFGGSHSVVQLLTTSAGFPFLFAGALTGIGRNPAPRPEGSKTPPESAYQRAFSDR
jgi:hypothetical protein